MQNLRELKDAILFAPMGSSLRARVSRANQTRELSLNTKSRPIVSMSALTYLEPLGKHFDSRLILQKADAGSRAQSQGLLSGDKLMQIGNIALKPLADLRKLLSNLERSKIHHMLFEHQGFQFFTTLELPKYRRVDGFIC